MLYYSTRDTEKKNPKTAGEAIMKGLAPDGGLYVPESFPALSAALTDISRDVDYASYAEAVLAPFFEGDRLLADDLGDVCRAAFDFPIVLKKLPEAEVLELFHGPTSAFKDLGARFLASAMETMLTREGRELTVLVATSGDTGGAVASAFHNKRNLKVKVLFPKGRVAERQKRQLTCWDGNVSSYEVDGTFDDCQKMVKDAFMDPSLTDGLTSANSINLGRLLPQMVYYCWASAVHFNETGMKPTFIIPSGNVGNCTGAYWAKQIGAPVERIVLAVNANKTIPDYLSSGSYEPRPAVKTLANAMDVGAPSNMERLFNLFPSWEEVKANLSSWSVSDDEIRETIKLVHKRDGYVMCPHTACGERVRELHFADDKDAIMVSTAHPAKFETVVEPLIGEAVPVPPALGALIGKDSNYLEIPADYHRLFS